MQAKVLADRRHLTRRTILVGAAALASAPAVAEECRIGPPQHHKGPVVFMDYDQVELDASYDQVSFTDAMANEKSPQRHIDKLGAPVVVTYGTFETPDFQRQSRDLPLR
jgi:arylformamidase